MTHILTCKPCARACSRCARYGVKCRAKKARDEAHILCSISRSSLSDKLWCRGRDLNPHDLTVNGFSYHYGFRRLQHVQFVVWTIPSPFVTNYGNSQVGAV